MGFSSKIKTGQRKWLRSCRTGFLRGHNRPRGGNLLLLFRHYPDAAGHRSEYSATTISRATTKTAAAATATAAAATATTTATSSAAASKTPATTSTPPTTSAKTTTATAATGLCAKDA